ncbi:MAG: FadR family transcriptional regulator [Hamadaea sp.]|nr:FadR family transcriptional regulator [Hamadaea sp.]
MSLRNAARTTLVQDVVEQLSEQIDAGEWPVGTRIPPEPDLVAALGVGRNTVREAVNALVHAGILERRQGSGTYVLATHELTGAAGRRLTGARFDEAIEVRRAFEVEAARLAALRRTPEDLVLLEAALEAREQAWAAGEAARFVEVDAQLHTAVVAAAHNAMLAELYASFGTALRASLSERIGDVLSPESYCDHSVLIAAIRDGDPIGAASAAGSYLEIA